MSIEKSKNSPREVKLSQCNSLFSYVSFHVWRSHVFILALAIPSMKQFQTTNVQVGGVGQGPPMQPSRYFPACSVCPQSGERGASRWGERGPPPPACLS